MIRLWKRTFLCLLLALVLVGPLAIVGCAAHAEYRVYDPDDGTYRVWNNGEATYYHEWERETHRRDRDFRKRSRDEQQQYWNWRRDHQDDNRDRH